MTQDGQRYTITEVKGVLHAEQDMFALLHVTWTLLLRALVQTDKHAKRHTERQTEKQTGKWLEGIMVGIGR